ncbi:hypothetical protein D3C87_1103750 [compost metagenome]
MRIDFEKAIEHINGVTRFMNKGSLKEAESFLKSDEEILNVENVNLDKGPGILVVTDKRVYFTFKVISNYEFKQIPYNEINSVDLDSLGGKMEIKTNHTSFKIKSINSKRSKEIRRNILDRI